jgi:hypothetical protein
MGTGGDFRGGKAAGGWRGCGIKRL